MDPQIEKILNDYNLDIKAINEINRYISDMNTKMISGLLSDDEVVDFLRDYGSYESSHDTLLTSIRCDILNQSSIPEVQSYRYDTSVNKMRKNIRSYIINNLSFDIYSNNDENIYSIFEEMCLDSNNRCSINNNNAKRLNIDTFNKALANKDHITVYSKDYIHKQNKKRRRG